MNELACGFTRRLVGCWNEKKGRRGHELPPPSPANSPASSFPFPSHLAPFSLPFPAPRLLNRSSSSVTWRTRCLWMVRWQVGVVGRCDVAYARSFSGDVAVGGRRWQRVTRRGMCAVTWHVVCPHPSTRGGAKTGDVGGWWWTRGTQWSGRAWVLLMIMPSLGPCGHSRGAAGTAAAAGCRLVVVRRRAVMGQCLATTRCQTLQLLLINV